MAKSIINIISKLLFTILLVVLFSCENREWNNPFDPDCPKELFTPDNLQATQQDSTIVLSWQQNNMNISGFAVERRTEGNDWLTVAFLEKNTKAWEDNDITGGNIQHYRIKALASSNQSNEVTTQIQPGFLPSVITANVFCHFTDSIAVNSEVINDGGEEVIERGICWSVSPNPTILDNRNKAGFGTGEYLNFITGLTNTTTYYIKSYATSNFGTGYSEQDTFHYALNVPGPSLTDVDGNTYQSVQIGNQIWMAENLKTTKYRDGTPIPNVTNGTEWAGLSTGAYCYFGNSTSVGAIYGGLYNFFAVDDNRGLCPAGWHVPADSEWSILGDYLGGETTAGGLLKETGLAHWDSPNTGASNSSGFTALAGSWRGSDGIFYYHVGSAGWWWTSTSINSINATFYFIESTRSLRKNSTDYYHRKNAGCSVRCIKD